MQIVADLIKDGRIGRLLEIRGRGKGDRRGGGEDLWVLGSHVLNMVNFLAGNPISCSAEMLQDGRRVKPGDVRKGAEGLGPLAGNELHVYANPAPNPHADGPSRWADRNYRRLKHCHNYYSP